MGVSFSYVNPFQVVVFLFVFFGPLGGQAVRRFSDALNTYLLTQYMDLTFIHSAVVMVPLMTQFLVDIILMVYLQILVVIIRMNNNTKIYLGLSFKVTKMLFED